MPREGIGSRCLTLVVVSGAMGSEEEGRVMADRIVSKDESGGGTSSRGPSVDADATEESLGIEGLYCCCKEKADRAVDKMGLLSQRDTSMVTNFLAC